MWPHLHTLSALNSFLKLILFMILHTVFRLYVKIDIRLRQICLKTQPISYYQGEFTWQSMVGFHKKYNSVFQKGLKLKLEKEKKKIPILKKIFLITLMVILGYLWVVANLSKSTGKIDLNIFKSEAIFEFTIFIIIATPFVFIIGNYLKKKENNNKQINKNE